MDWLSKAINSPEMKKRDLNIDALKGITIILVVLGHAIIRADVYSYIPNSYLKHYVFLFIYSFHMPLFIFLSGFITYGRSLKLKDKFLRLIVPFFTWYLVYYPLGNDITLDRSGTIPEYLARGVINPQNGLWFLWVLFFCYIFLFITQTIEKYFRDFSFLLVFLLINFVPIDTFGFMHFKYFFSFFALGYLLAKYKDKISKIKRYILPAGLVLFPALFFLWYPNLNGEQLVPLYYIFTQTKFFFIKYLLALFGILFSYSFIFLIKASKSYYLLAWLGLFTLDIYCSHILFLKLELGQESLRIVSVFAVALLGSLTLSVFALRKSEVLSFLFLGQKIKKEEGLKHV